MNATKRKFNTLLQGLGTPKTNPDGQRPGSGGAAHKTSDVETLLQKRRRLGIPQSNSTSITSASTTTKTSTAAPTKRPETRGDEKPLARFCPTDRNELVKRLATFHDITDWTPKPDRVSEIEWAKRGWVCHGKENVRCVLCHKNLVVKVNKKHIDGKEVSVLVPSEIEEALVDKYADLIVSSHLEDCLWRTRGCEETLLRLPLASTTAALATLRERYDELSSRKSFLPYEFNLRLPDDFKLDDILAELPPDFFKSDNSTEDSPNELNRVAFVLALFGWQGLTNSRIGAIPNTSSCHTCLRRLGLWMFKSKEVDDNGEVLVPAPMDYLDPIREHRFFCPWKNQDVQKRTGTRSAGEEAQPGWKVLLKTLENDAHLRSVYEGRSRTRPKSGHATEAPSTPGPRTPRRPTTAHANVESTPGLNALGTDIFNDEEDEKEREAKDKERWARLKRVKSLFDIRGSRKAKSASRPGTSYSTRTNGDANKEASTDTNDTNTAAIGTSGQGNDNAPTEANQGAAGVTNPVATGETQS